MPWNDGNKNNKAMVDRGTSPEEDEATTVGNMHQQFCKDCTCSSGDIFAERQTERYTDIPITVLAHPLRAFARRRMHPCYTILQITTGAIANLSTWISQLWHICEWTTIILSSSILPNSIYFLNLSPINAKLTLRFPMSMHQSHWYICLTANIHHYHSNNSYGGVRFFPLIIKILRSSFTLVCG